MNGDSFGDWESDRTATSELPSSLQGGDSNAGETERIRVSDMVRRLTLVNGRPIFLTSCSNDNEHEDPITSRAPSSASNQSRPRGSLQNVSSPLIREPERPSVLNQAVAEERNSAQVVNSTRIRERSCASGQTEHRVTIEPNISLPRIRARCSAFDQAEQRNFLPVGRSPMIRGRQAFNDLLMQLERDRHRELGDLVEHRAVSRFQQRGRVQSMLRLRLLQRGVALQEQQHLHQTPSNLNRPQVPTIPLPRERFDTRVEHGGLTTRSDEADSSTPHLERLNNNEDSETSSASSQISEGSHHHEVDTYSQEQRAVSARSSETFASEVFHEEASPSSDVTWQEASFEANNLDTQETEENSWNGNVTADEEEADNQQLIETNYDWFRDISRPRIHWEGRRQAWYQEMLESDSDNGEIRQLLERRRVSTFLDSDFRHRIDQLMMSRLNQQTQPSHGQEEEQDEVGNQERMGQLMMSFLQRHTHQVGNLEEVEREEAEEEVNDEDEGVDEEDEEEEDVEEEEEEESSRGHQYHEVSGYFDQTPSSVQLPLPSPLSSWSSYQYQDVGNDSDQAASTSLRQPLPSQSYYQDTQQSSASMNRSSLEMELIYDLRGHMEQLHQEISELRKSIKSCMDMQVQLQHSFKQEDHSAEGVGKQSLNRAPRKGSCCICYEMPVDSLLYRCGHMCTCLKCAHELQWSSGKCPICRAPIVDVVRAFADS